MTADTTALQKRIAQALFEVRDDAYDLDEWEDLDSTDRERWMCDAAAVLPIVAAEVRKAKAAAWEEYAAALEAVPDYAPTEYDRGRVDQRHATIEELHARAARRDEETR